jgi:ribokinase
VLPAGRNSIVVSAGANATLSPETAVSKLQCLAEGDFLLAQLETPVETVEAAFKYAKRRGATTVLDPAPARRLSPMLLANVDILTPNQTEAGMLLGESQLQIENFEDADIAAGRLLGLGPRAVMLKLGDMGCLYLNGSEHARAKAFRVNPVDTTAAGDAFNAALSVMLAEGASMPFAMRFANAAAAISVTRPGAQNSAPDRVEVEQFLGCVLAL